MDGVSLLRSSRIRRCRPSFPCAARTRVESRRVRRRRGHNAAIYRPRFEMPRCREKRQVHVAAKGESHWRSVRVMQSLIEVGSGLGLKWMGIVGHKWGIATFPEMQILLEMEIMFPGLEVLPQAKELGSDRVRCQEDYPTTRLALPLKIHARAYHCRASRGSNTLGPAPFLSCKIRCWLFKSTGTPLC